METAEPTRDEPEEKPEAKEAPKPPEKLDLAATLAKMKAAQRRAGPPTLKRRLQQLDALERAVTKNKDALAKAMSEDFGHRSRHEALTADIATVAQLARYCRGHLAEWMEPEPRDVGLTLAPARAEVMAQPLGVIGIVSPWNYPVCLALGPLTAALAAGNRAMIKPSEFSPRTGEVLSEILHKAFADDEVVVITGGADVGEAFTHLPFDHLVFTGSTRVGKLVMKAAAENLVPVTLELGGKSPAIVSENFALDTAAQRIVHGKMFNAGQTCIAPDYALVPKKLVDRFVEECKAQVARMYPTLAKNDDYSSVASDAHYDRLKKWLDNAKEKGAKLIEINPAKEDFDREGRKMPLTLVLDAPADATVMTDEIFGPILPIVSYEKLDEALDYINDRPRPLALYFFSHDDDDVERVLSASTAGGVTINDTLLHFAADDLPFGGVGSSGMGRYHGREGFQTFSHQKAVFYQSRVNATGLIRPPYGKAFDFVLRFLIGK